MKTQIEETSYPHLTREEAYRLVEEHEDDFHAIEGLAQALSDMSSSDAMPADQGNGVYRVAKAIIHQYEILIELHSQLFHGLHSNAKRAEDTETKVA